EVPTAFRARLADLLGLGRLGLAVERPRVPALGVVLAPDEPAVSPELLHQPTRLPALLRAERTAFVQVDRGRLDLVSLLDDLHALVERLVEVSNHRRPRPLSFGDVV